MDKEEALAALDELDKCTFSFDGRTKMEAIREKLRAYINDPGYERVPVDTRYGDGSPLITNQMKADNHGEHYFDVDRSCHECHEATQPNEHCDLCGGEIEYRETIFVPWDTCKEIYKGMVLSASKGEK